MHHGLVVLSETLDRIGWGRVRPAPTSANSARFKHRRFSQIVQHFRQCFWKFDRSAEHAELCRAEIARWADKGRLPEPHLSLEEFCKFQAASEDLQLFLDLMLFYLRIMADTLARLVPYMHQRQGIIPTRSFRDQRNWFVRQQPDFDRGYTAILNEHGGWFETLAGKGPSGLRDAMVHDLATYQLGWSVGPGAQGEVKVIPSLVNARGFIANDLISAIREITFGWCAFLDAAHGHFVHLLSEEGLLTRDDLQTRLYHSDGRLPSFWVYPTFED